MGKTKQLNMLSHRKEYLILKSLPPSFIKQMGFGDLSYLENVYKRKTSINAIYRDGMMHRFKPNKVKGFRSNCKVCGLKKQNQIHIKTSKWLYSIPVSIWDWFK